MPELNDMIDEWPRLESEDLADYRVFRVRRDRRQSPRTGVSQDYFVLEMPEWVNVIAVTWEGKVVLIHQYRHGIARVSLEIPGGMVDAADADPAEAARRELLEETGYGAEEIIPLGKVSANPAIQTNGCHTYLALGAHLCRDQQLDAGEDIAVELVDLDDIPTLIGSGRMDHALVVAAFYWLDLYLRNNPEVRQRLNR